MQKCPNSKKIVLTLGITELDILLDELGIR